MNASSARELFTGFTGRAVGEASDEFDRRVTDSVELLDVGEAGVALENLAQNLFEFDVYVSRAEYAGLAALGTKFGVHQRSWDFLEAIVND